MSHKITRLQVGNEKPFKHAGRCKCGAYSGQLPHTWEVDDWEREHKARIERIKAYLGTRTPTLKAQRDYYRDMAENAQEESDRTLWKQLAEELDVRVNDGPPTSVQDQLPFD